MSEANKVLCAKCGAEMNHHAMKIDYAEEDKHTSVFGGVLKEVHTCPECGNTEMRTA